MARAWAGSKLSSASAREHSPRLPGPDPGIRHFDCRGLRQRSRRSRSGDQGRHHGLPLVMMDITMQRAIGVPRANVDTLYSSAFLDLSSGPLVLSVPDTHGRYYQGPRGLGGGGDPETGTGGQANGQRGERLARARHDSRQLRRQLRGARRDRAYCLRRESAGGRGISHHIRRRRRRSLRRCASLHPAF
jgi:hypothetical protein